MEEENRVGKECVEERAGDGCALMGGRQQWKRYEIALEKSGENDNHNFFYLFMRLQSFLVLNQPKGRREHTTSRTMTLTLTTTPQMDINITSVCECVFFWTS